VLEQLSFEEGKVFLPQPKKLTRVEFASLSTPFIGVKSNSYYEREENKDMLILVR